MLIFCQFLQLISKLIRSWSWYLKVYCEIEHILFTHTIYIILKINLEGIYILYFIRTYIHVDRRYISQSNIFPEKTFHFLCHAIKVLVHLFRTLKMFVSMLIWGWDLKKVYGLYTCKNIDNSGQPLNHYTYSSDEQIPPLTCTVHLNILKYLCAEYIKVFPIDQYYLYIFLTVYIDIVEKHLSTVEHEIL